MHNKNHKPDTYKFVENHAIRPMGFVVIYVNNQNKHCTEQKTPYEKNDSNLTIESEIVKSTIIRTEQKIGRADIN